jgi:transposase-like protein
MNQFKSLQDVANHFNSEDKCRSFLEKMRWNDGRIICPICGVRDAYRMADRKRYKCKDMDCRATFTVTVGTYMENTKLPLQKWLMAMYLLSAHKKGISSYQLARDLGIRQKAGWFLLMRLRQMFKDNGMTMLSGRIEADEHYVGGKWSNMTKKKRAKLVASGKDNKVAIMGILERQGDAKLVMIGKDSLKDVIRKHVSTDAYINTDEHNGYKGLNREFADHDSVNHSQGQFVKGDVHTNSVEGMFSLFSRMIFGIYHQVSEKHLQQYCNEFTFRFNSRKIKDVDRFVKVFNNLNGRLTYNQLINKPTDTK